MEANLRKLKADVLYGAKAVYKRGLVDIGEGNISARVPGKEELLITPSFNDYETLTEQDIVHLKFDGKKLSGGRPPSSEHRLHVFVYKARPKARYIIHTHSPYATMLSVARKKILVLLEEMIIFLGGPVNVSEYGKSGTDEIGGNAVKALGTSNAILLANHGVLVCGRTMEHAVKMAELVEKMAKIYWGALQIGEPMMLPEKNFPRFKERYTSEYSTY